MGVSRIETNAPQKNEMTNLHSAVAYKRYNGLMKEYAENFIKMKNREHWC